MRESNVNDVVLNKLATIRRCLGRIADEFTDETEFRSNFTKQDSVVLNLQRSCEACIDICNHIIRQRNLGIPQSARNSFELMAQAQLISEHCSSQMQKMVGLRNVAVHDSQVLNQQALNLDIVIAVVNKHLVDFEDFSQQIANLPTR